MTVHAITTKDPLQNNTYVVSEGKEALVIDPAANAAEIISYLKHHELSLDAVLITHAHPDHTNQTEQLLTDFPAQVYLHEEDKRLIKNPEFSHRYGPMERLPFVFFKDSFEVAGIAVKVIHAPGHTPGSSIFQIGHYWFTGDVLFETQIGRDDFPYGSPPEMNRTAKRILEEKGDYTIMPGHQTFGKKLSVVKKINAELIEAAAAAK